MNNIKCILCIELSTFVVKTIYQLVIKKLIKHDFLVIRGYCTYIGNITSIIYNIHSNFEISRRQTSQSITMK